MNILVFYPTFYYSNSIEIKCRELHKNCGHVTFLTLTAPGLMHEQMSQYQIPSYGMGINSRFKLFKNLSEVWYLIKLIRKHKIDIVYAHLHPCIFIALLAQFLTTAKIVVCRHHSDTAVINQNTKEQFGDKIINLLAKRFLVPSRKVYEQLLKEGVPASRITLINYMYDFNQYPVPNIENVTQIRKLASTETLFTTIARFVPEKRHDLLVTAVADLVAQGYHQFKVMLLSEGPTLADVQKKIDDLSLQEKFLFVGQVENVIDYIEASDMIIHISNSEASNSIIKEAGLRKKTTLVCRDVGDFDDYITDSAALKIQKYFEPEELTLLLKSYLEHPETYATLGPNLYTAIFKNFSYENIISQYIEFHHKINQ